MSGPPSFRTVKRGYDPDEVEAHLAQFEARRHQLEGRLAQVEARIAEAERALAAAARDGEPPAEELDLIGVIQAGERAGDAVLAQALDEVARVSGQAEARIALLKDRTEVARLAAAVDAGRRLLADLQAARAAAIEDLESVHDGLERTREAAVEGLDEVLSRLAKLVPAGGEHS